MGDGLREGRGVMSDGVGRAVATEVVDCELDEGGVAVRDLEMANDWTRRDESVSTMFYEMMSGMLMSAIRYVLVFVNVLVLFRIPRIPRHSPILQA